MSAARLVVLAVALCLCVVAVSACGDKPFHPTSPPRAALEDGSDACAMCQVALEAGVAYTQNATDMATLLTALEADCSKIGGLNALLCDVVVGKLVKLLPEVPAKLFTAGYYTPQILCSFLGQCSVPCCTDNTPTQIHLSVGSVGVLSGEAMTVVWMTADSTADSLVQWGPSASSLSNSASAVVSTYTAGGWLGSIHTATMTGLSPAQPTFYRVGGPNSGWSEVAQFTSIGAELPAGFTFIQVGDMGAERNYSAGNQDYINYAASSKSDPSIRIQQVLHVGDISYADGYMERWDQLFTTLEPTASQMPYQTCPGNHEIYFNFSSYKARMAMPVAQSNVTEGDALYYSYDTGCVHFVALNSESVIDTPQIDAQQVAWLANDLATFQARRTAGREARAASGEVDDGTCTYAAPTFLVVLMHRPVYCNAGGKEEGEKRCGTEAAYLQAQVESLFQSNQVDLVIYGHVHAYERMANVYKNAADPSGPVYILNGSGGNREGPLGSWSATPPAWSLARIAESGAATLTVVNSTMINWQFYLQTDLAAAVADSGIPKPVDQVFIPARTA